MDLTVDIIEVVCKGSVLKVLVLRPGGKGDYGQHFIEIDGI
jgi:hypothetical protein